MQSFIGKDELQISEATIHLLGFFGITLRNPKHYSFTGDLEKDIAKITLNYGNKEMPKQNYDRSYIGNLVVTFGQYGTIEIKDGEVTINVFDSRTKTFPNNYFKLDFKKKNIIDFRIEGELFYYPIQRGDGQFSVGYISLAHFEKTPHSEQCNYLTIEQTSDGTIVTKKPYNENPVWDPENEKIPSESCDCEHYMQKFVDFTRKAIKQMACSDDAEKHRNPDPEAILGVDPIYEPGYEYPAKNVTPSAEHFITAKPMMWVLGFYCSKLEEHFNNSKSDIVTAINNRLLELAEEDPKNQDLVVAKRRLLFEIATEKDTTTNQEEPKTMGKN